MSELSIATLSATLSSNQLHFLGVIRENFVHQTSRDEIRSIFRSLDRNGDGLLSAEDFKHPLSGIDAELQRYWMTLRCKFDFKEDSNITEVEFFDGFILRVYFTRESEVSTTDPSIGERLEHWVVAFDNLLKTELDQFRTLIPYHVGDLVLYKAVDEGGNSVLIPAKVVHREIDVGYYTIQFSDGSGREKSTTSRKLSFDPARRAL